MISLKKKKFRDSLCTEVVANFLVCMNQVALLFVAHFFILESFGVEVTE